jgi:hypothetical protein
MALSRHGIRGDYPTNSENAAGAAAGSELPPSETRFDIAERFLHLSDLDNNVLERLGRYEMALWRQVRQTLFTLQNLQWKLSTNPRRRSPWRYPRQTEAASL